MNQHVFDVIVLGGGPAGLTAGIYLARAKARTLILNEGTIGGQLVLTHEIANYPGVETVSGYELASTMKRQAVAFGCTIRANVTITKLSLEGDLKEVEVNGKDVYVAPAFILAPGGRSRTLGVPGEQELKGKGISYCATCDGDFFQDKDIIVVGGGNSALEEAVSLTKYARSVTVVHQFDHFQAFPHAIEEARAHPKISFLMESVITRFVGTDSLQGVRIQNITTGEVSEREVDGVFVFIGYLPNTEKLAGKVESNERGEIGVNALLETSIRGVFAAGDSIQKRYRQVTTAVADGTVAALAALDYLHGVNTLSAVEREERNVEEQTA
jgi:thioredoxin reductase (NADPH)